MLGPGCSTSAFLAPLHCSVPSPKLLRVSRDVDWWSLPVLISSNSRSLRFLASLRSKDGGGGNYCYWSAYYIPGTCKMLYVLYLIKLKERYEEGTVILLTLQVRKLRPRDVK